MNYHTPVKQVKSEPLPVFMIHNNELVCPDKIFEQAIYPTLKSDMVKITAMNGQKVLIPRHKLMNLSSMDV